MARESNKNRKVLRYDDGGDVSSDPGSDPSIGSTYTPPPDPTLSTSISNDFVGSNGSMSELPTQNVDLSYSPADTSSATSSSSGSQDNSKSTIGKILNELGLGGGNTSNTGALTAAIGLLSAYGTYKGNQAKQNLPTMPAMGALAALPTLPGSTSATPATGYYGYTNAGGTGSTGSSGATTGGSYAPRTQSAPAPASSYYTYGQNPEQQYFQQVNPYGGPITPVAQHKRGGHIKRYDAGGAIAPVSQQNAQPATQPFNAPGQPPSWMIQAAQNNPQAAAPSGPIPQIVNDNPSQPIGKQSFGPPPVSGLPNGGAGALSQLFGSVPATGQIGNTGTPYGVLDGGMAPGATPPPGAGMGGALGAATPVPTTAAKGPPGMATVGMGMPTGSPAPATAPAAPASAPGTPGGNSSLMSQLTSQLQPRPAPQPSFGGMGPGVASGIGQSAPRAQRPSMPSWHGQRPMINGRRSLAKGGPVYRYDGGGTTPTPPPGTSGWAPGDVPKVGNAAQSGITGSGQSTLGQFAHNIRGTGRNPHLPMAHGGAPASRHVKGPGDGTSDSIPARLANGEYVLSADVVSGLGNGDNGAGAKKLDSFVHNLRVHKAQNGAKGKLPSDAKPVESYMGAK